MRDQLGDLSGRMKSALLRSAATLCNRCAWAVTLGAVVVCALIVGLFLFNRTVDVTDEAIAPLSAPILGDDGRQSYFGTDAGARRALAEELPGRHSVEPSRETVVTAEQLGGPPLVSWLVVDGRGEPVRDMVLNNRVGSERGVSDAMGKVCLTSNFVGERSQPHAETLVGSRVDINKGASLQWGEPTVVVGIGPRFDIEVVGLPNRSDADIICRLKAACDGGVLVTQWESVALSFEGGTFVQFPRGLAADPSCAGVLEAYDRTSRTFGRTSVGRTYGQSGPVVLIRFDGQVADLNVKVSCRSSCRLGSAIVVARNAGLDSVLQANRLEVDTFELTDIPIGDYEIEALVAKHSPARMFASVGLGTNETALSVDCVAVGDLLVDVHSDCFADAGALMLEVRSEESTLVTELAGSHEGWNRIGLVDAPLGDVAIRLFAQGAPSARLSLWRGNTRVELPRLACQASERVPLLPVRVLTSVSRQPVSRPEAWIVSEGRVEVLVSPTHGVVSLPDVRDSVVEIYVRAAGHQVWKCEVPGPRWKDVVGSGEVLLDRGWSKAVVCRNLKAASRLTEARRGVLRDSEWSRTVSNVIDPPVLSLSVNVDGVMFRSHGAAFVALSALSRPRSVQLVGVTGLVSGGYFDGGIGMLDTSEALVDFYVWQ